MTRLPVRLALLAIASALVACGGGGGGDGGDSSAPVFGSGVRYSYFPMEPGTTWILEGTEEDQARREEVRVLPDPVVISGVACMALAQDVFLDDVLAETTTEWYAQDRAGNVWKFGEESFESNGVDFVMTEDSWRSGVDGAFAFLAFPAQPRPGETFFSHQTGADEEFRVLSITDVVTVPAGTFLGCLRMWENPLDIEDADILLYAPGVGRVSETSTTGEVHLVAVFGG